MKITDEDMEKYGHKDDWNVDCLYLIDAQRMLADKLRELADSLMVEVVNFERKCGINR